MEISKLSKKDRSYFKTAATVSEQSDHRCRIGCVVVNSHHIISTGHNSATDEHGFQVRLNKKFFNVETGGPKHAEIDALLPLIRQRVDLTNATLYIYRKNGLNHLAMSRPCPRCMSVIKQCGIKRLKYTTPDGFAIELLNKEEE